VNLIPCSSIEATAKATKHDLVSQFFSLLKLHLQWRFLVGKTRATAATAIPMFVERKVRYSALFTNLVGWYASTVGFPLSDVNGKQSTVNKSLDGSMYPA